MKFRASLFVVGGLCLAIVTPTLRAQIVADGATNTLSNVTNTFTGDVTVGTNGSFTLLVLSDNALLTNSVNGVIGRNSTAKSNEVRLISSTARWQMGGTLYVGSNGVANRLVVSNGALLENSRVMIGNHPGSSNNEVVVSGPGSTLNSPNGLLIGADGNGNRLTILNGGNVFADVSGALTVIGFNAGIRSNSALVADAGSRWSVNATLLVGSGGNGNSLVVSNGALVDSLHGTIGSALTASNNLVIVTGAGSTWTNSGTLRIGDIGPGNQLIVSNGGSVFVSGSAYIGLNSFFSTNNRVTVDGATFRATNATASALLDVRGGTLTLNSGLVEVDQLALTNSAGLFEFKGGTLITHGAAITVALTVGASGTSPAVWDVRAGATNHAMRELVVGNVSSFNQVRITNGGRLVASPNGTIVGQFAGAKSNSLVISGAGSECYTAGFIVGVYDQGNSLLVRDGGRLVVTNYDGVVGHFGSNNLATVTGAGSLWSNATAVTVGTYGDGNRLVVSNGGGVVGRDGWIGYSVGTRSNEAVVAGSGAYWNSRGELSVGYGGSSSRLLVSDVGTVTASNLFIGYSPLSSNNLLVANGGAVLVTNAAGTGTLDVRHGTNRLDAGLITADLLLVTNSSGEFEFNGGQLITRATTNSNGRFFVVGNGTSNATLQLRGGTHVFTSDIIISSHGSLTGNGAIVGIVAVQSGGTLSPGTSIGTLAMNVSPNLQGTIIIEISKNGSARTNDQVQVAGTFFYGGSLTVSNLGPTALTLGDRFRLFIAPSYFGSFSSLTLPPLNPGLSWSNKLLVDGSIEVIGVALPVFGSISVSGTNVIITGTNGTVDANYTVLTATNVTTPLSNWAGLATNQFDSSGNFSFTNGIAPGELQRYFRIRTP